MALIWDVGAVTTSYRSPTTCGSLRSGWTRGESTPPRRRFCRTRRSTRRRRSVGDTAPGVLPRRAEGRGSLEAVRDHVVDDPVLLRLLGGQEVVALHVGGDPLERLPAVLGDDLLHPPLDRDRLAGMDLDVARLPLEAAPELVDEDLRVRERKPFAARAGGQQQRAQRHRDPDAGGRHLGLDELDRVVDGEPRVDGAPGAVDVERDVLAGILRLEMEQLGDRQVGDLIVDRRPQEDDPLAEQTRVDVEGALTVHGLLDHHRNLRAHRCSWILCFQAILVPRSRSTEFDTIARAVSGYRTRFEAIEKRLAEVEQVNARPGVGDSDEIARHGGDFEALD